MTQTAHASADQVAAMCLKAMRQQASPALRLPSTRAPTGADADHPSAAVARAILRALQLGIESFNGSPAAAARAAPARLVPAQEYWNVPTGCLPVPPDLCANMRAGGSASSNLKVSTNASSYVTDVEWRRDQGNCNSDVVSSYLWRARLVVR